MNKIEITVHVTQRDIDSSREGISRPGDGIYRNPVSLAITRALTEGGFPPSDQTWTKVLACGASDIYLTRGWGKDWVKIPILSGSKVWHSLMHTSRNQGPFSFVLEFEAP